MAKSRIAVSKLCGTYAGSKWKKLNRVEQDRIVPVEKRKIQIVKKLGITRISL